MRDLLIVAGLLGQLAVTTMADAKSTVTTKRISFEGCEQAIKAMSKELGVVPKVVYQTSEMRFVTFTTSAGRTQVTCSKPDEQMITAVSTYR